MNNAFLAYTGGIFSGNHTGTVNHAVLVVGYGTDNRTGTPYWVLRNSWGPSWGENGYMRMKRGVNQNGIVDFRPSYPTVVGAPPPPDPPGPTPPDPPTPAPDSNCPPVYTVKSGDTLRLIAGMYKASWQQRGACSGTRARMWLLWAGRGGALQARPPSANKSLEPTKSSTTPDDHIPSCHPLPSP